MKTAAEGEDVEAIKQKLEAFQVQGAVGRRELEGERAQALEDVPARADAERIGHHAPGAAEAVDQGRV